MKLLSLLIAVASRWPAWSPAEAVPAVQPSLRPVIRRRRRLGPSAAGASPAGAQMAVLYGDPRQTRRIRGAAEGAGRLPRAAPLASRRRDRSP